MLIDIATSNPPYKLAQADATDELKKRMAVKPSIGRLIDVASSHSGIETRYVSVPDASDFKEEKFYSQDGSYISPGTQARMSKYETVAKKLSCQAVQKLFGETEFNPANIQRLITISCTGFFAPGLDYYLIEKFNIPRSVKRTNIGFMGCAASIIGINSAMEAMNSSKDKDMNTLMVSVELCSLHLQTEASRDNILANMIFADGCAAALFSNSPEFSSRAKLKMLSVNSVLFDDSDKFMGWKIGNTGFEMNLSSELPKIVLNEAVPALHKIFEAEGIKREDIKHWALHPGGRAILDSLQEGLKLTDEEASPSRAVLRNYGNMSSASILFVLKEIFNSEKINKDELCCAIAFGPGLTMEMALMRGV